MNSYCPLCQYFLIDQRKVNKNYKTLNRSKTVEVNNESDTAIGNSVIQEASSDKNPLKTIKDKKQENAQQS